MFASDSYVTKLMDERNEIANLANTYAVALLHDDLGDHDRLEICAILGRLNSQVGQYDNQIAWYRRNTSWSYPTMPAWQD